MGLKGNIEVVGGILQNRRETEKEEQALQEKAEGLRRQREAIAAELAAASSVQGSQQDAGQDLARKKELLQSLDQQIKELEQEKTEQVRKRKDLCRIARTVTAGD